MFTRLKERNASSTGGFFLIYGFCFLLLLGCSKVSHRPSPSRHPDSPDTYTKPSTQDQLIKPYRVGNVWYYPLADAKGFRQRGRASWYGKDFHGRKTSNGEIYNMYGMTAAHKTLPLGTHVKVKNLENKREIEVRINDRGPFVRGRIIDLSYTAAKKIDMVGPGTAPVEIVALGAPVRKGVAGQDRNSYVQLDYFTGNFTIQVGAFRNRENALRLKQQLSEKYKYAHIVEFQKEKETLYRVRVGKCTTLQKALEYEEILIEQGFKEAMIVAE